ncbi:chloride channel protein [Cypionkella sp.]|uniref:chloride channel protein n=1 Tax=Cypionkella sp. TaxID=2811411 RepID=UPI00375303E8
MRAHRAFRRGMMRRSSALITSSRLWKSRLVFWAGALMTGVISAGFAVLADEAQGLFFAVTGGQGWNMWLPLVITPVGMVICALAADHYFPGSQGSGIPQAIAARHLRNDHERSYLLSMRLVLGKIVLTIIGLASGASIGREGPTVQVGASLMLLSARLGGMAHAKGLILAGSAAGIAAAFNTPLAGIVFAIEEMGRSYNARTNGVVLSAVIIAGVASLGLTGSYTYFGITREIAHFPSDWALVIACGVAGGVAGGVFSKLTLLVVRWLRRIKLERFGKVATIAAAAGLLIAIIGIATGGMTFGTSYAHARAAVEGQSLPWYFFMGKFVVTLASTVSGIPGGLFAPSLAVGAGLGSVIGALMGSSAGLAAVLGMSGYFAGVVQAPMTAFVIIVEMTGNHENVVPVMAAAMIGYGTSRLIAPEPLYHALSRIWAADIIRKIRSEPPAADPAGPVPTSPEPPKAV